MVKASLYILVLCIIFHLVGCKDYSKHRIFRVEDFISKQEPIDTLISYFEITHLLYLDTVIFENFKQEMLRSKYLNDFDLYQYPIEVEHKVNLSNDYANIVELMTGSDKLFQSFCVNQFRLTNPYSSYYRNLLVYKNRCFVEVTYEYGNDAFVIELSNSKTAKVTLVMSTFDHPSFNDIKLIIK